MLFIEKGLYHKFFRFSVEEGSYKMGLFPLFVLTTTKNVGKENPDIETYFRFHIAFFGRNGDTKKKKKKNLLTSASFPKNRYLYPHSTNNSAPCERLRNSSTCFSKGVYEGGACFNWGVWGVLSGCVFGGSLSTTIDETPLFFSVVAPLFVLKSHEFTLL